MNYEEILSFMRQSGAGKVKPGLRRIKDLLNLFGNPQYSLKFVHVAGTNGKGSVSAMLASILAMSGERCGLFTSPYLERFTDRMRVLDGRDGVLRRENNSREGEIGKDEIASYYTEILESAEHAPEFISDMPSPFEVLTAAAFMFFRDKDCSAVVLETGLGGLLDCTNVIPPPEAAVITALGYDHCNILGSTIEEIAFQKAGIIKKGSRALILYDPHICLPAEEAKQALSVIKNKAKAESVPLELVKKADIEITGEKSFKMKPFKDEFRLKLDGDFQFYNAALAIKAAAAYNPLLSVENSDALYEGILHSTWPGRMEKLAVNPDVIADGAHNPMAAEFVSESLNKIQKDKKLILLFAVLKDKNYKLMLEIFEKNLGERIEAIVLSSVPNPRTKNPLELYKGIKEDLKFPHADIIVESDPKKALKISRDIAAERGCFVFATGSLYFISEIRNTFLSENI